MQLSQITSWWAPARCLPVLLLLVLSASVSEARSWRVEKDGTGDFAVIQDAVDVSASGDTISVGPGRFTEYTTHVYSGNNWYAYVHVVLGSVTIIGSGDGITYIGPETPDTWNFGDYSVGILYFPPQSTDRLRVSGVSIADVRFGQYIQSGACTIEHCGFQRISKGIQSLGPSVVSNCKFQGGTNIDVFIASPATSVLIQQCEFTQSHLPFNCQLIPSILVEDCVMTQCANAGMFDRCAGTMRRCNIAGTLDWGLGVYGTGAIQIMDNTIDGGAANIYLALGANNVNCERNVLSGSTSEAINISNCTPRFVGNHILKGTGKAVRLDGYPQLPDRYVDMTGNYWGSTSADSISAWIVDGNDLTNPQVHGYVNFVPFSSVPVGTRSKSFGDLKALFR